MVHQQKYKVLGVRGFLEGVILPGDIITVDSTIGITGTRIYVERGGDICEIYCDALGPRKFSEKEELKARVNH